MRCWNSADGYENIYQWFHHQTLEIRLLVGFNHLCENFPPSSLQCNHLTIFQSLAVIATIFLTLSVAFGLGEHLAILEEKSPELIAKNQFYQWIFTTFAIVAITLGKIAIIAFILQIEGTTTLGKRKWVLYGFPASNLLVNIIILPIIWVQCSPTAKIWDDSLPGNCNGRLRNQLYGYFQGSRCYTLGYFEVMKALTPVQVLVQFWMWHLPCILF